MGSKKTEQTQTSSVQGASAEEQKYRKMLMNVGYGAAGQLGDLSGYANGSALKLTQEDLDLIAQAVGSRTSMATGELKQNFASQNAELEAMLAGTGQKDSSIELFKRLMKGGEQSRALADVQLQGQAMGAEYGMQLPFQRANAAFGANSAILARLGAGNPALESFLRERLANTTQTGTTTQSGFSMGELAPLFA
jgi:hypothetical protein